VKNHIWLPKHERWENIQLASTYIHFFHLKEAETATYWGKNPVFYMIWFPIQTNAMSFLPDSRGGCVTTDNFSSSFGFSDWVLNTKKVKNYSEPPGIFQLSSTGKNSGFPGLSGTGPHERPAVLPSGPK
jgi:hypothetical protein